MEVFFKKYSICFLVLILTLAIFFRLYQIKTIPPALYPDEAMNGINALEVNSVQGGPTAGWKIFYPDNNGREGLFINIQALSIKYFGNEPWALRIVSAFFGVLTVLGVYLLAKEMFGSEFIALFSSFFMATSFWHIIFSRIGLRAIMAPFFLTYSLWLLFKIINKIKNNFQFSIFQYQISILSIFAGFVFGLGFHSYIAYRATPVVLIPTFLWLLFKMKRKDALIIFLFSIGAIIAIAPLANYFYQNPQDFWGRAAQISIFTSLNTTEVFLNNFIKTVGMFFVSGDLNWRHNFSGSPQLWYPVSALFLIGIMITINIIVRKTKLKNKNSLVTDYHLLITNYCTLIIWLIGLLLPAIFSNDGTPHALRSIIVIPVSMIFAALGLDWLIQKINDYLEKQKDKNPSSIYQFNRIKAKLIILLFAFFITVTTFSYFQYFIKWGQNPSVAQSFNENYTRLGYYLRRVPNDIKKYVFVNSGDYVQGISMPQQVLMFLTDTASSENQKKKNITYVLPQDIDTTLEKIKKEKNLKQTKIFLLIPDPVLRKKLFEQGL